LKVELEQAKNEISKEKRKAQARADEAEREQVVANDKARAEAAKRAGAERKQANAERDRADAERKQADAERERAEAERERAEANERASRLEAEMRELRQKLRGGLVGSDK